MVDTAIVEMPTITNPERARKGRNKKALKPINPSTNEANIAATGMISQHSNRDCAAIGGFCLEGEPRESHAISLCQEN
ncbi:hypothetical protein U1Q18_021155 [Sarracenia purpurea var. burkii]